MRYAAAVVGLALGLACPLRAAERPAHVARASMPDRVYTVFRRGIAAYPFTGRLKTQRREKNLAALERLREGPWPDLGKLQRVRVHYHSDLYGKDCTATVWRVPAAGGGEEKSLLLMPPDLTLRRFLTEEFTRIEPVDYADELAALVRTVEKPKSERPREWDLTLLPGGSLSPMLFHGEVFLLHHAYAASWFGRGEEADRLVRDILAGREAAFDHTCERLADYWFGWGTWMLSEDRPWGGVLDQWQQTLRYFPRWRYHDQLEDVVGQLAKQITEMSRLAESEVADPNALPPQERIAYEVARLPEVRGLRFAEPGSCRVLDMRERTRASDALVAIGRPAVPALIEHLDDRRVTRSVTRRFAPKTVLRVQDVAIECIKAIVDVEFHRSDMLSDDPPESRQAVIEEVRTWWAKYGHRPPVEGQIARLRKAETLFRRLHILRKIEALDPNAVDSVALLKQWAIGVKRSEVPDLVKALLERGDRSLLPAAIETARRALRKGRLDCVSTLLAHGGPGDFRVLREAAVRERAQGDPLVSSGLLNYLRHRLPRLDRPLAVPLLVDFLDERRLTDARRVPGRKEPLRFSTADDCMQALVGLTGHDAGYRPAEEAEQRFAAIDRWTLWWKREGREAYLTEHPDVRKVMAIACRRVDRAAPADLPPETMIRGADPTAPIAYRVPREQLTSLIEHGQVEATRLDDGDLAFRFAGRAAAHRWFESAGPVPAQVAPDERSLTCLGWAGNQDGVAIGPDGRTWLWRHARGPATTPVQEQIETAAASDEPVVTIQDVRGLLIDRGGRIWVFPSSDYGLLLGYDPQTRRWTKRRAEERGEPAPENPPPGLLRPIFIREAYEGRAGDLFFAGRCGIHVLRGRQWSYHRCIEGGDDRNDKRLPFRDLGFREDADGRLYVWPEWNEEPPEPVGCFVFDGERWEHLQVGGNVEDVVPLGSGEVRVVRTDMHVVRVRGTQVLRSRSLAEVLGPNLRFRWADLLAVDRDGRAYFWLVDVTVLDPFEKTNLAYVAWEPDGTVRRLEPRPPVLRQAGDRIIGPDGWLWMSQNPGIAGMSPDGRKGHLCQETRHLGYICFRGTDSRGNLYFYAARHLWRLNPRRQADHPPADWPRLPAVRIRIEGQAWPDSLGRVWCTWDREDLPPACFDGNQWRVWTDGPAYRAHEKFTGMYPGADGAMLFATYNAGFFLHDAQGWAQERSVVELAEKHRLRLRAVLTYPPPPTRDTHRLLTWDGKGRIWWGDLRGEWGVVDEGHLIDGKAALPEIGPGRGLGFIVMAPLGDGDRMLLCDREGGGAVVTVRDGQILRLADAPPPLRERWSSSWHPGVFREREGRLWVVNDLRSVAVDGEGRAVETREGRLVLQDRRGGLWFQMLTVGEWAVVRRAPDGREVRLRVPPLRGRAGMAEAPDGTAWAMTTCSLIRLRAGDDRLTVVEEYPVRAGAHAPMWCDLKGRLWCLQDTTQAHGRCLVRYATTPAAPAP